jgi:acyl dehydratase
MALDRDCLGKAYGPVRMTVDAARIAAYAAATADPVAARRDGDSTAPPVFGVVPVWPAIQQVLADTTLGLDVGRVVHGEQRMTFHRLIRAGDELTTTGVISAIEDRGANEVFVLSFETRDARDELVTAQDVVCVSRGTGAGAGAGARPAARPPAPDRAAAEADLVRVVDLPADITYRYAAASGDDNRIHVDEEFARRVGLPGIIVQGLCLFSIALEAVIDAAAGAEPARVRTASARFLRPLRPGGALHTLVYRTAEGARFEGRGSDGEAVLAGSATTA